MKKLLCIVILVLAMVSVLPAQPVQAGGGVHVTKVTLVGNTLTVYGDIPQNSYVKLSVAASSGEIRVTTILKMSGYGWQGIASQKSFAVQTQLAFPKGVTNVYVNGRCYFSVKR